jgi:His-Xaa-Ser system protein HxsD
MKGISIPPADSGKVVLSKEFFEREPVFAAASRFTDRYYVGIQPADEYNIEVSIQPKKADDADENIVKLFCNELVDQQVRHDLQNRFGKLREMIVEQAFYPLEKK